MHVDTQDGDSFSVHGPVLFSLDEMELLTPILWAPGLGPVPAMIWLKAKEGSNCLSDSGGVTLWSGLLTFLMWWIRLVSGTLGCPLGFPRRCSGQWGKTQLATAGSAVWQLHREHLFFYFLLFHKERLLPQSSTWYIFLLTVWDIMTFKHIDSSFFVFCFCHMPDATEWYHHPC